MAVVLRLQGLTHDAGSEDIRMFFRDLHIPEGGVLITGGKKGEAFIIFTTEKDGQLAMRHSGRLLRGAKVSLHISSLAELKHKMELGLKKHKMELGLKKHKMELGLKKQKCPVEEENKPAASPEIGIALLHGLVTVIQGLQTNNQLNYCQSPPANASHVQSNQTFNQVEDQMPPVASPVLEKGRPIAKSCDGEPEGEGKEVKFCKPGYLRLYGLPKTVTKMEVCQFLSGLSVLEVIVNVPLDSKRCCLVKVATFKQAEAGLKYSNRCVKDVCVKVRLAHEKLWTKVVAGRVKSSASRCIEQKSVSADGHVNACSSVKRQSEDRLFPEPIKQRRTDDRSFSWSPDRHHSKDRSLSGSPQRHCSNPQPFRTEYRVIVRNLPKNITKTEIKGLFSCTYLPNNQILHLLNKWGERTSTAFIMFTQPEDYTTAMNMNGSQFGSKVIEVLPVTKEKMKAIMKRNRFGDNEMLKTDDAQDLTCIYVRNFPANVQKVEVKDFFGSYHVRESDITLLKDNNGNGIGEAVVWFGSELNAKKACGLHGTNFMGEKVLLRCITPQQMEAILQ